MITRPRIKTLYSIAICASSALAIADDSNSDVTGFVYVGSGYITDSQFKFGEYNALEEQGAYQVLDFRLTSPSVKQTQWSVTGENIGLSVPRLEATLSHAGNYGVYAEYSEFTHNRSNTGHTVFTSTDTSSLELPSGWVAANTTAGMSGLSGPLLSVKESLERKRLTLAYDWLSAPNNWSFDIAYMHETKEGNRVRYGVIGNTGGNPRAAALPTPVDFVFDELRLQASYQDSAYSATLGYQFSQFENDERQQVWRNPFSAINGWDASAGYPSGQGAIALEPDNQYQQIYLAGTARLSPKTRLNGRLDYGLMQQDETFLPYTINPSLNISSPLPRDSLEGEIAITRASLGFHHTLSQRLALDINARYENRENKTPTDLFIYIGGDSQNQNNAASNRARYNIPFDFREQELDTNLRYRAGTSTNIRASYQYRNTTRDASEVRSLQQQTAGLAVSDWLGEQVQWRLEISHERRHGSRYQGEKYFLASHTPAYINSLPADERFENLPALRRYYLADRHRNQGMVRVDWLPDDQFQVGLSLNRAVDDYPDTDFGLQSSRLRSAYLDMSYTQPERFTWSVYAGHEVLQSRQTGRSFRGFALVPESQNPERNWRHNNEDAVKTLGAELEVNEIAPRTNMTLGYLLSHSKSLLEFGEGALLSSEPLPDQGDKMMRLSLELNHQYSARIGINLNLGYEKYNARNYSTDGVTQSSLSSTIALGNETPNYSVHWFLLSLSYGF